MAGLAPPPTGNTGAMSGGVIEVSAVSKSYAGREVLRELTFTAQSGRVTGLLGPNGSGKSTIMKIMLGLASADAGRATIGGRRYRDHRDGGRRVGALVEANAFHPGRTGRNHLRILAAAEGVRRERVDEVLAEVGLTAADRRAGEYSLGMRQRLGVAGAILGDPTVLVLDEPANGLDPLGIHEMRDMLRARAARGHTVLVSSHLLSEMELLADDVVVIHQGRVIADGALADLRERETLVRTPEAVRLRALLEAAGAEVEDGGGGLVVRGMEIEAVGRVAFEAGVMLAELSPHARSLEDRFLAWTTTATEGGAGS